MADFWALAYVLALSFLGFGLVKSFKAYRQKRELPALLAFVILLILASELWITAYGGRLADLLGRFRLAITFIPLILFLAYHYWENRAHHATQEKKKVEEYFSHYLSPAVIAQVHEKGEVVLGGKRKDVTVLVSDVRDSTQMALAYKPEVLVSALNQHFTEVTQAVLAHGGTVDKITGDGVMAIFNAPLDLSDHTHCAYLAAEDILRRNSELNRRLKEQGLPYLKVGVGLDAGEGVVGNIGSHDFVRYTVIGDVANTASRVQGFADDGQVVMTDAAFKRLNGRVRAKGPFHHEAKGKGTVAVYKVSVR